MIQSAATRSQQQLLCGGKLSHKKLFVFATKLKNLGNLFIATNKRNVYVYGIGSYNFFAVCLK